MKTAVEPRLNKVAQVCENIPDELSRALRRHCEFVGQGADTQSLMMLARRRGADAAVVDLDGVGERDRGGLHALTHELPRLRLLLLGSSQNLAWVQSWLAIGAQTYLHKGVPVDTVVRAVLAADRSAEISIHLPHQRTPAPAAAPMDRLSQREVQVLALAADAMSNRQIARSLNITEGTVKRHMRNIFQKLGSHSRIDSVNKAATLGLLPRERHRQPTPRQDRAAYSQAPL
ncbi:helix-turn-helix transcriptional regulator [Nocardiopsis terrae]